MTLMTQLKVLKTPSMKKKSNFKISKAVFRCLFLDLSLEIPFWPLACSICIFTTDLNLHREQKSTSMLNCNNLVFHWRGELGLWQIFREHSVVFSVTVQAWRLHQVRSVHSHFFQHSLQAFSGFFTLNWSHRVIPSMQISLYPMSLDRENLF